MGKTTDELRESESYKIFLSEAMAFYESEERKNYSAQRVQNDAGDIDSVMQIGLQIIDKNGGNLLSSVSELRKERIKKDREEACSGSDG